MYNLKEKLSLNPYCRPGTNQCITKVAPIFQYSSEVLKRQTQNRSILYRDYDCIDSIVTFPATGYRL